MRGSGCRESGADPRKGRRAADDSEVWVAGGPGLGGGREVWVASCAWGLKAHWVRGSRLFLPHSSSEGPTLPPFLCPRESLALCRLTDIFVELEACL